MAQVPAPASSPAHAGYSVDDTPLGTLFDDPAAKTVIDSHLPGFSSNPQLAMARGITLRSIQQYAPDRFTDKLLADIQADLSALPPKKP